MVLEIRRGNRNCSNSFKKSLLNKRFTRVKDLELSGFKTKRKLRTQTHKIKTDTKSFETYSIAVSSA